MSENPPSAALSGSPEDRIAALEAELAATKRELAEVSTKLQRFVALLDNSTEFIGIATLDGTPLFLNRTGREMVGLGPDHALDVNLTEFFPPEVLPTAYATVLPTVQSQGRWVGPFTFRNFATGASIPVHYNLFSIFDSQSGELLGLGTVTRDLSIEKSHEEARQNLVAVIENSSEFIGIATPDGTVQYVNEAGRRLLGLLDDEAAKRTAIAEYFLPEDLPFVQSTILPAVHATGRWEGEFRFRHFQTGEAIPVHYSLFAVYDKTTGAPIAYSTVTRDIREQKRREQERQALTAQIISAQESALRELSTPLIPLADQVIAMPLMGTMDEVRAQQMLEVLLRGVSERRATRVILDITGVPRVDLAMAQTLVRAARAVRLLGADLVLTGIRPEVAQTLVSLGTLTGIRTHSTLQDAVAEALAKSANRPR